MLRPHYHDETQLILVAAGRRRVMVGNALVELRAGEGLLIPRQVVHRVLSVDVPWDGFNLYVSELHDPAPGMALRIMVEPDRIGQMVTQGEAGRINDLVAQMRPSIAAGVPECTAVPVCTVSDATWGWAVDDGSGADLAARETRIRRLKRSTGITPHAADIVERLNRARVLLAQGCAPALVAANAGFSDQSHLGRQFRAHFGATPARYAVSTGKGRD